MILGFFAYLQKDQRYANSAWILVSKQNFYYDFYLSSFFVDIQCYIEPTSATQIAKTFFESLATLKNFPSRTPTGNILQDHVRRHPGKLPKFDHCWRFARFFKLCHVPCPPEHVSQPSLNFASHSPIILFYLTFSFCPHREASQVASYKETFPTA